MISEFVALLAILLGMEFYIGLYKMDKMYLQCQQSIKHVEEKLSSKGGHLTEEVEQKSTETNGGWGTWSVWTACSATCDTGLQTRQRQCNNPVPSSGGQYCDGGPMDVVLCNQKHCPRIKSSFTAKNATRLSSGTLSFQTVLLNEGSNFNGETGTFTCQHSGFYVFIVNVVEHGIHFNSVLCSIWKNSEVSVFIRSQNPLDSTGARTINGYGSATGAATLHLKPGDTVIIWCDSETVSVLSSLFTGFLVAEDY